MATFEEGEKKVQENITEILQRLRENIMALRRDSSNSENPKNLLTPDVIAQLRGVDAEALQALIQVVFQTEPDIDVNKLIDSTVAYEKNIATIFESIPAILAAHPQELSTDIRSIEKNPDVIDTTDTSVSADRRRACTNHALSFVASLFQGIDEYAVFAGTAFYLHTKEIEGIPANLKEPPGDLDVHIWSKTALDRFTQRIENMKANPQVLKVHYSNDGQLKRLQGQETQKLSGYIDFLLPEEQETEGQKYRYHFEVFFNERGSDYLFDTQMKKTTEKKMGGIRVLSLEGLQRQYGKNAQMEYRVENAVKHLFRLLTQDPSTVAVIAQSFQEMAQDSSTIDQDSNGGLRSILQSLGMSLPDLAQFYHLYKEYEESDADSALHNILWTKITAVLGPFKAKPEKRERRIEEIREIRT